MSAESENLPATQTGTITLGGDLTVNRMGFGAMRITGQGHLGSARRSRAALATLRRAVELGVNFIDTADSYGPDVSEELIAEALYPYPTDLVIATKAGWTRHGPGVWQHNASPAHIEQAIEGSLKRLRLDRIDVYQLHVPDPAVLRRLDGDPGAAQGAGQDPPRRALQRDPRAHSARAKRSSPSSSVQNRYSFSDREWDFVLDYCAANGIALHALGTDGAGRKANEVVEKIAAAREVSTAVVSLAWLLRRSPVVLPIPGTGNVKHLEENVSAAAFRLTEAEFAEMNAVMPKPYWLRG